MINIMILNNKKILCRRKKLKKTFSKAKTSKILFKNKKAKKDLWILEVTNFYNHFIKAIDEFNHLTTINLSFRHVKRGGH